MDLLARLRGGVLTLAGAAGQGESGESAREDDCDELNHYVSFDHVCGQG